MKRRFAPWNARKPSRTCVEALRTRETEPDEKTLENRKYIMYFKEGKKHQKRKKKRKEAIFYFYFLFNASCGARETH
jgi:hypothetical protein